MVSHVSLLILLWLFNLLFFAADPIKSIGSKRKSRTLPGAYIVEFKTDFARRYTEDHHEMFYRQMANGKASATPRMNLSSAAFIGASFYLQNPDSVSIIRTMDSVANIWPVTIHPMPDARVKKVLNISTELKNDMFSPNVMGGVDKLHSLGYAGKDVVIAIIDTGVDYLHPALGGGFGPRYKFQFGYDFVGDDYDGYNTPVPDPDPFDCNGHGTHVSGTIGSNGPSFVGVAPNATLGMYRVFGCTGSTTTDILITAYGAAQQAGAHIITASIGGASGWTDDPLAIVVSRIAQAGVTCTIAAANSGDEGLFYGSSGASGIGAVAVASVDNIDDPNLGYQAQYTIQAGSKTNFNYLINYDQFPSKISGYPLYALGLKTLNQTDACLPLPSTTPSLSKKIVLVPDNDCLMFDQLYNLYNFGAKYVMFYLTEDSSGFLFGSYGITVGEVSNTQGILWLNSLRQGLSINLYFSADPPIGFVDSPNTITGGKISTFSSWYPTNDLYVKPEIAAPGGNIFSTYPVAQGSYAILSGTSMATPYIAGVAALYLNAKGFQNKVNTLALRSILVTTANPLVFNDGWTDYSYLAPVIQQESGLVNAFAAVNSVTRFNISSIAFNDTANFKKSVSFTITNTGNVTISYSLSHRAAATAYTLDEYDSWPQAFLPDLNTQYARARLSPSTLTLPSKRNTTITVVLTAPTGLVAKRIPVYSGYITINGNNSENFSIPYVGVGCVMKNINVTDFSDAPPSLTYFDYSTFDDGSVAENQIIHLSTTELTFNYFLIMPSSLIRLDILGKGKQTNVAGINILGSVPGFPLYASPRNVFTDIVDTNGVMWNGTLNTGVKVPAGSYRILYRALRIFGDRNNAKDYESWQSPMFKIVY